MNKDIVVSRLYQFGFLLFPVLGATVKDAGSAILTLLVLAGLIYGWRGWGELSKPEKNIFFGFGLFFLTAALAMFMTDDWHNALKRLDRFLRFLLILPVYLTIKRFDIEITKWYLVGIIISGFVLGAVAVTKVIIFNSSTAGPYNSSLIGLYAVISAAFLLAMLVSEKITYKYKYLIAASLSLAISGLVLSEVRVGWLAFFVMVLFFTATYIARERKKLFVPVLVITLLSSVALYQVPAMQDRVDAVHSEIQKYEVEPKARSSFADRVNMWRNMILLFKESPLVGVGMGDYLYESNKLVETNRSYATEVHGSAHSIYFESLGTTGIIGLIGMLLGLFVIPIISIFRLMRDSDSDTNKLLGYGGLMVIIIYGIIGITSTWFGTNPLINGYLIATIACLAGLTCKRESFPIFWKIR